MGYLLFILITHRKLLRNIILCGQRLLLKFLVLEKVRGFIKIDEAINRLG
jgi:hypothetical protein